VPHLFLLLLPLPPPTLWNSSWTWSIVRVSTRTFYKHSHAAMAVSHACNTVCILPLITAVRRHRLPTSVFPDFHILIPKTYKVKLHCHSNTPGNVLPFSRHYTSLPLARTYPNPCPASQKTSTGRDTWKQDGSIKMGLRDKLDGMV
jgi:hypothetical protein